MLWKIGAVILMSLGESVSFVAPLTCFGHLQCPASFAPTRLRRAGGGEEIEAHYLGSNARPRQVFRRGFGGWACKILSDERASVIPLVIQQSKLWVDTFIIGLNLCPFAQLPFKKKTIRYAISGSSR
jgi:hypothetical protein